MRRDFGYPVCSLQLEGRRHFFAMKPIGSACCSYLKFSHKDGVAFVFSQHKWAAGEFLLDSKKQLQLNRSNSCHPPLVAGISFCFVAKFPALNPTQTLVHRREPQITGDQVFQTKVPSIYSQHGQHFRCVSCSLREIFFLLWQGLACVNTAMANHMWGNLVGTIMFLNSSKNSRLSGEKIHAY